MRSEHATVGCVADGTGTLDLLPVTEQDMDVTEGKQSCVNSVQGLPSTVSEDPDEIESMSARPETATPDVWALLVTTAKNTRRLPRGQVDPAGGVGPRGEVGSRR